MLILNAGQAWQKGGQFSGEVREKYSAHDKHLKQLDGVDNQWPTYATLLWFHVYVQYREPLKLINWKS